MKAGQYANSPTALPVGYFLNEKVIVGGVLIEFEKANDKFLSYF
jgi:hypothetical protein